MNKRQTNLTSGRVSRRRFLMDVGGAMGAMALSACAMQPPAAAPSAITSETTPTDATTSQPQASVNGPIAVKDGEGNEIKLAKPAKRIVVLGEEGLDFLVVLDVQPVGFGSDRVTGANTNVTFDLPHYFPKDKLGSPTFIGTAAAPSLEAIVSLKPDLILTTNYTENNDQLSKAAPTFVLNVDAKGYWRETLKDLGLLLARTTQAETFINTYDDSVKQLAEQTAPIAAKAPNLLLVYSYSASDGTVLLGNQWTGSEPFTKLGFTVMELDGVKMENGVAPISPETVAETKADIIFILRPKLPDGSQPEYPIDALLNSRKDTRVIYQVFHSTRASTAPYTDKQVLEEIAMLVSEGNSSDAAATFPRTVKDAAGIEVTIPSRPQRVVSLQNLWDLDAVLALGIVPAQFGLRSFIKQYTGSELVSWKWHEDTIKKLGGEARRVNGDETNIEGVVAAKPDLIVGMEWSLEKSREQLTKVAPVIQLAANWRESLKVVADVFGEPEKAAKIIAATDQRIADSIKDLNIGTKTLAIISCYDNIYFNGFGHPADGRTDLFQRAGFTLLDAIASKTTAESPTFEFSIELLPILEPADVIVLFDYGDGSTGSGILENPLFKALPAVKAGRLLVLKQGELAQGMSTISPINIDCCLEAVREAAQLALKA